MSNTSNQELKEAKLQFGAGGKMVIHHGEHDDHEAGPSSSVAANSLHVAPSGASSRILPTNLKAAAAASASPVPSATDSQQEAARQLGANTKMFELDYERLEGEVLVAVRLEIDKHMQDILHRLHHMEVKFEHWETKQAEEGQQKQVVVSQASPQVSNSLPAAKKETSPDSARDMSGFVQRAHIEEDLEQLEVRFQNRVEEVNRSLGDLLRLIKVIQKDGPRFKRKQELQCIAVGILAINTIGLPEEQRAITLHDLEDRGRKLHQILVAADHKDERALKERLDEMRTVDTSFVTTFPDALPTDAELQGQAVTGNGSAAPQRQRS